MPIFAYATQKGGVQNGLQQFYKEERQQQKEEVAYSKMLSN